MNEQKEHFIMVMIDEFDGNDLAVLKNDGSENIDDDDDISGNWQCCMK